MVEYSSRMLLALEEYSARASRNAQVAMQALRLRRALATSLWSASDGVLGQFSSLSKDTVTALRFNGISTFDDVVSSSEEQLERVAKRKPPFGQNLLRAVHQTLASALKMTAKIEYACDSTVPSELVCILEPREEQANPEQQVGPGDSQLHFTLIAYTDLPGGFLLYKKNLNSGQTFRAPLPQKFGSISCYMIASMVGLDGAFQGTKMLSPIIRSF